MAQLNEQTRTNMFHRRDYIFFISSAFTLTIGFCCMALDPVENGFGILTLWIAPPLLMIGFMLPIPALLGAHNLAAYVPRALKINARSHAPGLLAFAISLTVYLFTLEPTASLWDCSEFIAAAYKLQVPHTPGTPLSLLLARICTVFAFGNTSRVAWSINAMSAFFSASTVWVIYYIIRHLGYSLVNKTSPGAELTLSVSALVGSLCLAFSDTFWFSAVEAETYAAASFFLLLLVLLILKGRSLPAPSQSRCLVLIGYLAGLAYCIHPMCLLALPMLPFAWYTKSRSFTMKSFALLLLAGMLLVLAINRLVAVGLFELAFYFDLFFVNTLHLTFYSGALFLVGLLTSVFYFLLRRFASSAKYTWSLAFLFLGFLPYLILFIRSNHNPPIDETNPENLSMIKAYMNRETYPSSPLLYGPYFDAQVDAVDNNKKIYHKRDADYAVSGTMGKYHYDDTRSTILPRLYSKDADHIEAYRAWTGLAKNEKPRFTDNLRFMLAYQFGHMYLRYFMWNFSGRESDHQGSSWLNPWDGLHQDVKDSYNASARNQLFMLPLCVGILGMFFQWRCDRKGFLSVLIFFLVTGFILALYLNTTPNEPRERDYIYVGSYIAFCIWIGLGVLALLHLLQGYRRLKVAVGIAVFAIPSWMCYQNYDDHNRAARTFQIDNARNVLNSCAANALLFTGGDNDTFPLWYLQEVEGYRTDVRVMVLSYLNTDWYINQLRKGYYASPPFALSLDENNYRQYGLNDVLYVEETIPEGIPAKKYLELLKQNFAGLQVKTSTGDAYNMLPSRIIKVNVDQQNVRQHMDFTNWGGGREISATLNLKVNGNYLQKNGLAVIDLIVSNNWERPLYFNFTSLNTVGLDLNPYVVQEGNVFRLVPIRNNKKEIAVNTTLAYQNLVEKSDYTNLANPEVHFNYEDYQARIIAPARQSFNMLAEALMSEGNGSRARETLRFAAKNLYPPHLAPSYTNLQAAEMLLALNEVDLARALCTSLFDFHYNQLATNKAADDADRLDLYLVSQSAEILNQMGSKTYLEKFERLLSRYETARR